jgi:iron complex transport system ATP-binding protein
MAVVLQLSDVFVTRGGTTILNGVSWTVDSADRWVVLGPNGAGKTTLLQLAAALMHPSRGSVEVLGHPLGRTDVFELRPRVGFASTAMAKRIPPEETVLDVVLTAAYSVTGRWSEQYEDIDVRRAQRVLAEWHLDHLADRRFGNLSDGEQKRVQISRAVMTDPELLLLDEPAGSLDLGAREELVQLLGGYASAPAAPGMVMVTHHVEEIPVGFTHALLLRDGAVVAAGPIAETVTSELIGETFGLPVDIQDHDGRFTARAALKQQAKRSGARAAALR